MTDGVSFRTGGAELIDAIEPMWQQLILVAASRSLFFSEDTSKRTFEERRQELMARSRAGAFRVDIAVKDGEPIGYCVSSVDGEGTGEIDSLFVSAGHRGQGIGGTLVRRAMAWMDSHSASSKIVLSVYGNEDTLSFYRRLGFRPRMVMMEHKTEE